MLQLIKIQLLNLLVKISPRNSRKRKINYFIVILPIIAILYYSIIWGIEIIDNTGLQAIYITTLSSFVACVMFQIVQSQGHLFDSNDFESLIVLPIQPIQIMLSKMLSMYISSLLFSTAIIVPSAIYMGIKFHLGFLFYIYLILGLIFLPILAVLVTSTLAIMIRFITNKIPYKKLANNIVVVLVYLASFYFWYLLTKYQNMSYTGVKFHLSDAFIEKLKYLPTVYYYAKGLYMMNTSYIWISILINAVAFVGFIYLFNRLYIYLNMDVHHTTVKKKISLKRVSKDSVLFTLFKKEFNKFITNFLYILNLATFQLVILGATIYLVWNKAEIMNMIRPFIPMIQNSYFIVYMTALISSSVVSNTACVSISLEGKNFWILKVIPAKVLEILYAKILVNVVVIAVPGMISLLLFYFFFEFSVIELLLGCFIIILVGLLAGQIGIIVNLWFPKFEFDREVIVIKQSLAAFVATFTGMFIGGFNLFLSLKYISNFNTMSYLFTMTVILLVTTGLLHLWIATIGKKTFERL